MAAFYCFMGCLPQIMRSLKYLSLRNGMLNSLPRLFLIIFSISLLSACGGGGGGSQSESKVVVPPPPPSYSILGGGIKGPLSGAEVKLYSFDVSTPNVKDNLVSQGITNGAAEIQSLQVTGEIEELYLLEFNSIEGTVDISTNAPPIVGSFSTLITAEQIDSQTPVYASPLSQMVLALIKNELAKGKKYEVARLNAETSIRSFFGLGLNAETLLLNSPALFTSNSYSIEQALDIYQHRRAIEAFSIMVNQLHSEINDPSITHAKLIDIIAIDIADGFLNGINEDTNDIPYSLEQATIFSQFHNDLVIPNTGGKRLTHLAQMMVDETAVTTGSMIELVDFIAASKNRTFNHFALKADHDGDGIVNSEDNDDDNDSVLDSEDLLPLNANEYQDTDLDGIGNNSDSDDDNDGVNDEKDLFPLDKNEVSDFDQDGVGDNADNDDDNDSVLDDDDAFPFDNSETKDTDLDGIGNNADLDDDNDGFDDQEDAFPLDKMEWVDTDLDGIGNNTDSDDDNDGVYDNDDELPLDSTESLDFDKDGIGDIADNDDDNDNIADIQDNIHVSLLASTHVSANDELTFYVRGFFDNGAVLEANDGWHVQYYITDLENGKELSFYTDNGYYNASFLNGKNEWQVKFPAPSYSGNFQVSFSLYCSKGEGVCSPNTDQNKYHQWGQVVDFSVTCETNPCGYQPEPEPGRNISASSDINYLISATRKDNGNVIAAYVQLTENSWKTYIVESPNKGYSWNTLSRLPNYTLSGVLIENREQSSLLMMAICGSSYCLYESESGKAWTTKDLFKTTNFLGCLGGDCNINHIRVRSFLVLDNGSYMVTYDIPDLAQRATYQTTSTDLEHWTEPTLLFGSEKTGLHSLLQLESGRFIASYESYDDSATVISISEDGENWDEILRFDTYGSKLFDDNGIVRLFYRGVDQKLYEQHTSDFESFSAPKAVVEKVDEKFDVVSYGDNEFGIIYTLDLNFQYDVFHEKVSLE